jgi:hypothetical protein
MCASDKRQKNADVMNCYVMLYLQYACDMMTSQVLCPVAINKYYQGAEECIYVQSETLGVIFILFFYFTPEHHREVDGR